MTLVIENVKDEFLPTFKELAKAINARIRTDEKAKKTTKQVRIPELDEAIRQYENGEYETYNSVAEMMEALRK
ncbi:hypothetical protein CAV_0538 [Campylobacter avium LMG 24591]|uniref:Uncharacterized protein n=1 Tax=Campylobacter avium LMG 24591 TaxID=522484 RepID=A0A222MWC4_9BACT|nr:hypothetical protein [Campylobacter avium]ASQ30205.1 hypothetical protein CAV_0538 [Campylobacter avium LMG 24591]